MDGRPSEERAPTEDTNATPHERVIIGAEDSDRNSRDPAAKAAELGEMVQEKGAIECPCGWAGDATEARIFGTGSSREINCPLCDRLLFAFIIEDA